MGKRLNAGGYVHAQIAIAPDGSVRDAKIVEEFAGTPVGNCVLDEIKRQKFPASRNGAQPTRQFPLRLVDGEHETVEP